jgi:hypothetical protein
LNYLEYCWWFFLRFPTILISNHKILIMVSSEKCWKRFWSMW